MTPISLTLPEHKELASLISRNLHLLRDYLDDLAGIPGDYSDSRWALFARVHDDLERMQHLLERTKPRPLCPPCPASALPSLSLLPAQLLRG